MKRIIRKGESALDSRIRKIVTVCFIFLFIVGFSIPLSATDSDSNRLPLEPQVALLIDAGANSIINFGDGILLQGSAVGGTGNYSFFWSILSGPDRSNQQFTLTTHPNPYFLPFKIGVYTLKLNVSDGVTNLSDTVTIIVTGINDVVVSQGLGGQTLVNYRNLNPDQGPVTSILRSFRGCGGAFLEAVGGGIGRITYVSTGDVNGDSIPDTVVSFGPVTAAGAVYPNIIVVRDGLTSAVVGHSFQAFPTGSGSPVNYNWGEVRTAVGDFSGVGSVQIAAAQGYGGDAVVRLFEYTGDPAPNGWQVVGQFNGLVGNAQTNNAKGGITLAAGDLDGDGDDELLVGQTNSGTSQTIFHVLDIQSHQVVARYPYAGFQEKYRGNGGVELAAIDLNGDGRDEILAASQGNDRNHEDQRDDAPINVISVIEPVLNDGHLTGFTRPLRSVITVWNEDINPSGSVSLTRAELNGDPTDGDELVVGTGSIVSVSGTTVSAKELPLESRYRLIKINYSPGAVNGVSNVIGSNRGYIAYMGETNPSSGSIYVASMNPAALVPDERDRPSPTPTFTPLPTGTPTITPTPTPTATSTPTPTATPTPLTIGQWDFSYNLDSTFAGGFPLIPKAVAPAETPAVSYIERTIDQERGTVANIKRGTYFELTHGFAPNGGGQNVNQYTLVMDFMLYENPAGFVSIFQADPLNSNNNGQLFVSQNGIGFGQNFGGTIQTMRWYRIALVVNAPGGYLLCYINGEKELTVQSVAIDGPWSLESTALLFADNNELNASLYVNSVQIRDHLLDSDSIRALGGPQAAGIP